MYLNINAVYGTTLLFYRRKTYTCWFQSQCLSVFIQYQVSVNCPNFQMIIHTVIFQKRNQNIYYQFLDTSGWLIFFRKLWYEFCVSDDDEKISVNPLSTMNNYYFYYFVTFILKEVYSFSCPCINEKQ